MAGSKKATGNNRPADWTLLAHGTVARSRCVRISVADTVTPSVPTSDTSTKATS
jgi:hypothetical protein